jgi:hypothetical protein
MTGSDAAIQKQAAGHFKQAMSYIPNYKDSATRYEEARSKAVRRIAVITLMIAPIPKINTAFWVICWLIRSSAVSCR